MHPIYPVHLFNPCFILAVINKEIYPSSSSEDISFSSQDLPSHPSHQLKVPAVLTQSKLKVKPSLPPRYHNPILAGACHQLKVLPWLMTSIQPPRRHVIQNQNWLEQDTKVK
uniref:Uncharacterized protein n=1 Tax=Picea sitchensis TaxID=3332 RepID=A0A6B9XT14_PICSI|nr:hypothetical protein Q903MT_gene4176 [Picea sitchensis]